MLKNLFFYIFTAHVVLTPFAYSKHEEQNIAQKLFEEDAVTREEIGPSLLRKNLYGLKGSSISLQTVSLDKKNDNDHSVQVLEEAIEKLQSHEMLYVRARHPCANPTFLKELPENIKNKVYRLNIEYPYTLSSDEELEAYSEIFKSFPNLAQVLFNKAGWSDEQVIRFTQALEPKLMVTSEPPQVAVLAVDLEEGCGCHPNLTLNQLSTAIQMVENTPNLEALVLNISSHANNVREAASIADMIQHAKKPIYSYIYSHAIMSGYVNLVGSEKIYAAPYSEIGYLGVIAQRVENKKRFWEHVKNHIFFFGKQKGYGYPQKPFTKEEAKSWERIMDQEWRLMKKTIFQGRGLHKAQKKAILNRENPVWTAQESVDLNLGLIDGIYPKVEDLIKDVQHRIGNHLQP